MSYLGYENLREDVMYNNVLQDGDAPDPKRKFGAVTEPERRAQLAALEAAGHFSVATICGGGLGLYEFTRFLEGKDDTARALGSLVVECASYRAALASKTREGLRQSIEDVYLTGACPSVTITFPHPHLKRTPLQGEVQAFDSTATKRLKSATVSKPHWPFTTTKCTILRPTSDAADALDKVDTVAIRALSAYLPAFKRSEECAQLLDFYFRQKRPSTPEEFDKFRVLGKGGFGTVTASSRPSRRARLLMRKTPSPLGTSRRWGTTCR